MDGVLSLVGFNFRAYSRDQLLLLPPSLHDWLPEDHLAWFLVDVVEQLDLSPILQRYRSDGWGGASYDPSVMLCVLLYGYCGGERSSRRIERLCQEDVGFRVVSANLMPDHTTIARFRRRHENEISGLFIDVLKLCHAAGLVKVGKVALDGTKMEANASFAANRTFEGLKQEVQKILAEAEAVDREEDQTRGPGNAGDGLPEAMRNRQQRLDRLRVCKERLEQEAAEKAAAQQAKVDERKAKEEAAGKKLPGRRPKAPDATVDENARANPTDPDSRVMTTRRGFIQGYNAQAVVTSEQIIVAAEVTQDGNDFRQLHPMLTKAKVNLSQAGVSESIGAALADAGFWTEENALHTPVDGTELYVNTKKDWKLRKATKDAADDPNQPSDLSPREQMEAKLATEQGWNVYKTRATTIEPTFGQIKDARGCDRFVRRGLDPCDSEWKLLCLTHNLLKLWRHATGRLRRPPSSPELSTAGS